MGTCKHCGKTFSLTYFHSGKRRHLKGRRSCFDCRPFREGHSPRIAHPRDVRLITCERCGARFPAKILIDGKWRSLYRRRFCLDCSPFGGHNTSRAPLGDGPGIQHRRRERRNSSWRRYQRRRRGDWKARLLAIRGSRCEDCGYDRDIAALEFHHRRGADKLFSIGGSLRRWEDILAEAEKCDLLCANCHRLRHLAPGTASPTPNLANQRRDTKVQAVESFGRRCGRCGRDGPPGLFEFHHIDARTKSFGLGAGGLWRPWVEVAAELQKCVMLCPNCHREKHTEKRRAATMPATSSSESPS